MRIASIMVFNKAFSDDLDWSPLVIGARVALLWRHSLVAEAFQTSQQFDVTG